MITSSTGRARSLGAAVALAMLVATLPGRPADAQAPTAVVTTPLDDAADAVASAAGLCNDVDPLDCLLPLPSDVFTTADAATPTGLRIDFSPLAMPRNVAGVSVNPTEWNRNDGWSPGSTLLTFVPGLDLATTFGIEVPLLEAPSLSVAPDAPIVLVDTTTGLRHPYFAELDQHPETDPADALLIIRPLRNFLEGHRYVVGLRQLKDSSGAILTPSAFDAAAVDEDILAPLAEHGVAADELYLAWDFTIASGENLAGRVLAMRDDAFAQLGDEDLADGVVTGSSPAWEIVEVSDVDDDTNDTQRIIEGTVTVPYYLDRPNELGTPELTIPSPIGDELPLDTLPGQALPGTRLQYGSPTPAPMDRPEQNALTPTIDVPFTCSLPRVATSANPARPTLYGHGLLGSRGESRGSSTERMREAGYLMCGVDWFGFFEGDLANIVTTLLDVSNFASVADRVQQGFVNFLYVGRALIHPDGVTSDAAFRDAGGAPLVDTSQLFYDGNSQGGIMGGALTALSPDFTRATLGVVGMNYSTLLHRSVDFEGTLADEVPVGYSTVLYQAYPDKTDQLIILHLLQMLWDRAEANGYAQHLTRDPLPNTPAHQVLLHVAYGDYQVANVSAEVEARTAGARILQTSLPPGRHWADAHDDRLFDFTGFDTAADGSLVEVADSALVYWDSGNPTPPSHNVPPEELDQDPHSDPRKDPLAMVQKDTFYTTGRIVDVHEGAPYCTPQFPRDPAEAYDCTRLASGGGTPPAGAPVTPADGPLPATGGGLAVLGILTVVVGRGLRRATTD